MPRLLDSDQVESRAYQEVIAASALDEDTLVVLPTGLGKTVIAAMVAAEKLEDGKVLFLAPTKPLVQQHKKSFNRFLKLPEVDLKVMTGDIRPAERYSLWNEKAVFFATPQVVENDLISGEIPREDFSLVIFDEAHRATGEYSYVFISEKMQCQRLALTASPGGSKEKIMDVKQNLGVSNFEVRTEDDPDVAPYIEDKKVDWVKVSLDERFEKAKNHLEEAYRDQLKELKKKGFISSLSNVHKQDLLEVRGKISAQLSKKDDPKLYSGISRVATAMKISQALELLETQGVSQCYSYLQGLESDDSKAASRALNHQEVKKAKSMTEFLKKKGVEHPKLERLREILDLDEGEKAIVFTEYRDSTELIVDEMNVSGVSAESFVGQRGEKGMSQSKQKESLKRFENGEFQVLVSTSIGEEGLDIPAVDYVVFYEPIPSGIRDIQRMGRTGRQESGKVFVLMAEDTRDEAYFWSAQNKKKKMKKVLHELKDESSEDLKQNQGQKTLDRFNENAEEISVIADDRENSVAKELSKMELDVSTDRLDIADFLVSDRSAVERKKASDFVDSIVDQRLFDQLTDLQQFENPVLLIEGENLYSHRDIHPNAVRGALASVALDLGIPVLWSEDVKDTAELLKSLAKREQEENDEEVSIRGTRSVQSEEDLQKFIVAGLPAVNTKLSERLLEEFGSVEAVFTASETELKSVEGIGEKKASKIRGIVSREYGSEG